MASEYKVLVHCSVICLFRNEGRHWQPRCLRASTHLDILLNDGSRWGDLVRILLSQLFWPGEFCKLVVRPSHCGEGIAFGHSNLWW